ncbi:unnamed protein product [Cylindrotheca closterium]|uniref:Syndetin C-terminal domain-containing protein n=1 Tax=Cylindrotheca closterium TaxID=2856 RepID=A0AAD2GB26_9STRA|nr:unnamed protein product [Cylindrotheca closterium]
MVTTQPPSPSRFHRRNDTTSSTHSSSSSSLPPMVPSKNKRSYERRSRLRVWLKHSMTPTSPSAFSENLDDLNNNNNNNNNSGHGSILTVSNIDQALQTNYKLTDLEISYDESDVADNGDSNDAEDGLQITEKEEKEDWAFGTAGHPDNYEMELERTRQLKAQLAQSPLDFLQDAEDLEEEWKWKFGKTGKQEFQFASFEASFEANFEEKDLEDGMATSADTKEDAFAADFSAPTETSPDADAMESKAGSSGDGFGDFQQSRPSEPDMNEAEAKDKHESDVEAAMDFNETRSQNHPKEDDLDDENSDFGDFQEAPPSPDKIAKPSAKQAQKDATTILESDGKEDFGDADDNADANCTKDDDNDCTGGQVQEHEASAKEALVDERSVSKEDMLGKEQDTPHFQGSLKSSTSSAKPPFDTPKSADGVSTLLNDFNLDFQDFPTPNTLLANAAAAAVLDAATKAETASIEKAMQENNPQDPSNSSVGKLRMPTTPSSRDSRNRKGSVLRPRNYQTSSSSSSPSLENSNGEGNASSPQKISAISAEPITPIIHNQSAKKTPPGEPMVGLELPRSVGDNDKLDLPSMKPAIGSVSSAIVSEVSRVDKEQSNDDDGSSSIPSVVRVVAAVQPRQQWLTIDPPPPPPASPLFPTEEQEAYYSSPSAMKTPVGRFLRRLSSSQMEMGSAPIAEDGSEDGSDDDGSLASLQKYYYDEQDSQHQDKHILQVLKKLEWEWMPYWQWDSLLYPVNPNAGKRLLTNERKTIAERSDDAESDEELEDWMVESKIKKEQKVLTSASRKQSSMPSEDSIPLFQNELVQQLSDLDSANVQICKRQYRRIQPHADRIEEANSLALEMSKNLQICNMYMQRSTNSVCLARNGQQEGEGVNGAMDIVDSWNSHSAYMQLEDLLEQIEKVTDLEKGLLEAIETFDPREEELCQSILKTLLDLNRVLNEDPLLNLDCLNSMRQRCSEELLKKFRVRMHSCLESIAVRCCNADSETDSHLQQEYHQLAYSILRVSETINGTKNEKRTALEICTSLQTAWLLQTQRSFGLALLDPTDDSGDSEYDKELSALSSLYDINVGTGLWFMDPSKLSIWTKNLITIRLDFEIQIHPLPAVVHKLCSILFHALHGHYALWKWHKKDESPLYRELYQELGKRRPSIWNACIQVLEDCFEEYLKYVGKKRLFPDEGDEDWLEDLEGLEDVASLIQQFLSLQSEFLKGLNASKSINDGSLVEKRLQTVLQTHVRAFHIQSMNKMGLALYHEEWSLETLKGDSSDAVSAISKCLEDDRGNRITQTSRSKKNHFKGHTGFHFARYAECGNPFSVEQSRESMAFDSMESSAVSPSNDSKAEEVLKLLNGMGFVQSTPRCVSDHALRWIARSLLIVKKLPTAALDVAEILENITNLYLTTAFRLCAGSADHEKFVLGISSVPIPDYVLEPATPKASSQNRFGFGKGSSNLPSTQEPIQSMTSTRDAELCAPLPCELDDLSSVQKLILNAQDKLQGVVKLDLVDSWIRDPIREPGEERMSLVCRRARVLEKRQSIAWSCVFVVAAAHLARNEIHRHSKSETVLDALDDYVNSALHAAPILLDIASRTSCIRAVGGKAIVQEILNLHAIWEEPKLHESCNKYVDSVCDICSLLWWSISNSKFLPKFVLERTWHDIMSVCYTSMIDGFARVPYCSTEGRALMSMDVTTLTMGLLPDAVFERLEIHGNAIAPPNFTVKRGMRYVDTFIKVFYFPPLDAYNWIEENYMNYQRHHAIALIAGATFASGDRHATAAKRVIVKVKALYNTSKPKVEAV